VILSSQNSKIKLVRALASRPKERREAGAFVVEGVRLMEEALAASWPIRFVLYTDQVSERGRDLIGKLQDNKAEVEQVDTKLMTSLSETETSQGMLAVLDDSQLPIPESPNFLLIPDSIRDPGNLGTLLRTANAAGVQAVLLPPESVDAFAPKVVRAGMGAHFRLPIRSMSWDDIREHARGLQVYLADVQGVSYWEADLKSPLALIVGSEAEGAGEAARKLATALVSIPMRGQTESLNAAAAGSVLMFEVLRQRSAGQ
jgi:RNA methyltransferase, TrmH family